MYGQYRLDGVFPGPGVDLVQQQAGVKGLAGIQDPNIASLPGLHDLRLPGIFRKRRLTAARSGRTAASTSSIDSLTWIKGKHIMKFGGRMYHRNILFTDARSHNGAFAYTGVMTQRPVTSAGTGRLVRRFHARVSRQRDALEPRDVVGRNGDVLAWLLPG